MRASSLASAGRIVAEMLVTPALSHASSVTASEPKSSSSMMLSSRHVAADRSRRSHSSPDYRILMSLNYYAAVATAALHLTY